LHTWGGDTPPLICRQTYRLE